MLSNFNITLQFQCLNIGAQAWVQYSTWGLIRIFYIFKTTFTSLVIKFLTIQPIISLALYTIDKIWYVSSKPNPQIAFSIYVFDFPEA